MSKVKKYALWSVGVIVALVLVLEMLGSPEQVEVTVSHGYSGGMEQRIARLAYIADDPLPIGKVIFNDGICSTYYERIGFTAEGIKPKKGQVLVVSAPVCNGGGPIYKVEYITQDGQSWTYRFE
jgi:hypothetical protein